MVSGPCEAATVAPPQTRDRIRLTGSLRPVHYGGTAIWFRGTLHYRYYFSAGLWSGPGRALPLE
jgi:hypothetical protein